MGSTRSSSYTRESTKRYESRILSQCELSLIEDSVPERLKDEQSSKNDAARENKIKGTLKSAELAVTMMVTTAPFLVFVGILLHLVLDYQVAGNDPALPNLQLPGDEIEYGVYLVNYSATKLTTIASWASNIAAVLPGCIMTMFSYRLAQMFTKEIAADQYNALLHLINWLYQRRLYLVD